MPNRSFRKKLIAGISIFIIFFAITHSLNNVPSLALFAVSGIRPSAAMNPVLGIIIGWPAIIACAAANFVSDVLTPGYGIVVALLGFVPQVIYGALPYHVWKRVIRSASHRFRLDSPLKTVYFAILMAVNAVVIGIFVGAIQYYVAHMEFRTVAVFAAWNDFDMCMILGLPMMALADHYYSGVAHNGRRRLSVNERIILISAAVQAVLFGAITAWFFIFRNSGDLKTLWNDVLSLSGYVINIAIILSVAVMLVVRALKKRYAGLRVFERKDGTVFADEKRHLEFVSAPGRELRFRVKSSEPGFEYDNNRSKARPSFENSWLVMLSNQKGCPMHCEFCDCPSYGYHGNASLEDLEYQLRTALDNTGSRWTKRFEVNFMRMGEPTFNRAILEFIEFRMRDMILDKVSADEIIPSVSTMCPHGRERVLSFLQEYCRIKNDVYDGGAGLQFSINTTDEQIRRRQFRNMSMPLEEIAGIIAELPMPKGSKYALDFAVTKDSVIDAGVIDSLFDREKCMIKLTPVHGTFNALDNGFSITSGYDGFDVFERFEKGFTELGWDVVVYTDSKEEDEQALTCGNLLLPNISDRISRKFTVRKKVGMIVAIEMDAFFSMYPDNKEIKVSGDFRLYYVRRKDYDLYVLQAGMGEIAASAGVQYLITKCGVSMIINFGVVGGLTPDMKKLKVCLVDRVVHYKYDCSAFLGTPVGQVDGHDSIYLKTNESLVKKVRQLLPSVPVVTCCSGDKFVDLAEEKISLHETFGGDICDMESAGIVLTCEANHIPCLMLKAVSDGLADGAAGFMAELLNASRSCLEVTAEIIEEVIDIET